MKHLSHVVTRFVGSPLMIHPPKLEVMVKALAPRLGINIDAATLQSQADADSKHLMARYSEESKQRDFAFVDGVAVIPIQGTLMKRCSGLDAWSGCCSYEDIASQLSQAMDDPGVNSVLLDIDSPGGEVSGVFDLVDAIYSMRGRKPMYAVANDCALSAAYAIASAADKIYVNRTGAVGSIGVFALHAERSKLDAEVGVKYTYVFAGERKVDGNPHEPLSDRAQEEIQTEVTREYNLFTETVARNRAANVKEVVDTKARVLWADAGLPLLADEIGTFDDAMQALLSLNASSTNTRKSQAASAGMKGNMAETITAAVKPSEIDEKNKAISVKADADPEDPKKKDDSTDPDSDSDDDDKGAKASAVTGLAAAVPATGTLFAAGRTDDDIQSISNLCKLARVDAAPYLLKKVEGPGGKRYASVGEISKELADIRAAETGRTSVTGHTDTNTGGKLTIDRIASEAAAFSRANKFTPTSNLYVEGTRKGTTPEQAMAAALESNPDAYAQYRERHNAQALIATLQNAGVKVAYSE